jgi:ClpP class serine protease
MRGDVAVIPVCGPIFRRANMLSEVSGATSIQVLAQDFNAALANDDVKSIVLEIDSPGGEVTGVSEFAEMVFAARGTKPIVAYVGGDGCSAAYWIASACEHIVVADTAIVGSIGVVRAIPNPGAGTASAIEIVSSQSPNKRPDVKTSKGRAVFQAEVDALADVFVVDGRSQPRRQHEDGAQELRSGRLPHRAQRRRCRHGRRRRRARVRDRELRSPRAGARDGGRRRDSQPQPIAGSCRRRARP